MRAAKPQSRQEEAGVVKPPLVSPSSPWRLGALAAFSSLLSVAVLTRPALADAPPGIPVDRIVARYTAPEMGDTAHPRFVFERILAFEARLGTIEQGGSSPDDGYVERDVRNALDRDIAEEMLATLASRLVADSPADKRPSAQQVDAVRHVVVTALLENLGGRARVDEAARVEGIDPVEVNALLERSAMAAWYLDRAVTPILHPSDDQLREVYRTSEHPYRGQPYEQVRPQLERWFVLERLHVAESGFLQAARSRLRVIVTQ
jgi:hypothetical protein